MWEHRSEGGACVVFGKAQGKGRKVLLLSQKKMEKKQGDEASEELNSEVWNLNYQGFSPELAHIERREWFTRNVVAPITRDTGAVSLGEIVQVRPKDLGVSGGESNPEPKLGLLMDDALTLRPLWVSDKSEKEEEADSCVETISVEIKPKCGVMPSEKALLHPGTAAMKRKYSRYQLQQRYKKLQGKIQEISEYDPRDLFDREASSKQRALKALFKCPQNNLTVYRNYEKIFPAANTTNVNGQDSSLETGLGLSVEELRTAVSEALQQQQGLLDLIRSLQARDVYGIEMVHRLYCSVLGGGKEKSRGGTQQENETQEFLQKLEDFCEKMPRAHALGVLQDYLIAATFKDCSLILTLSKFNGSKSKRVLPPNAGVLSVHDGDNFVYQIQLIDTDMKDASKIPQHYDLDKRILSSWNPLV